MTEQISKLKQFMASRPLFFPPFLSASLKRSANPRSKEGFRVSFVDGQSLGRYVLLTARSRALAVSRGGEEDSVG